MLVLSRMKDEKIIINDNITIMVIDIRGDKIRLGIEAPNDVSVHRQEVYDAIKRASEKQENVEVVELQKKDDQLSINSTQILQAS